MPHDFDLLILGAGSGGVAASRRAALHGAKVGIVEGGRVGGTCVIRGCVPKKLLMYAAQFKEQLTEAAGYGWHINNHGFEMSRWADHKAAETDRLESIYRKMLADGHVELIEGWAAFDGPHHVIVNGPGQPDGPRRISAQHIVIATGALPIRDSIPGIDACATSDDVLDLRTLPSHAAVVGGGYIAVEFASMLVRLGVQVHLFFRNTLPLRGFDDMLRQAAAAELAAAGVVLHAGQTPQRIQKTHAGFSLLMADGHGLDFPWVLNATGRRPNTAGLNLVSAGVAVDGAHAVKVNTQLQTTVAGVHAIGDVTNRKNLTPVAIAEGRALADLHFDGTPFGLDLSRVASAVFMLPAIATVGPSEAEAVTAASAVGHRVKVFETDFRPMKTAFAGGTSRTRIKLLVDAQTDRVMALHMVGQDAPEIVQSLSVALTAGATKAHFDRTIAMHPTVAEEFVLLRHLSRTVGTPVVSH
jgi:glutathione reductase (NADPH)